MFGPIITGFSVLRGADSLQFSATVTPGTGSVSPTTGYAWTWPDATGLPGTTPTETVVFTNSDPVGDVVVTVTDSNSIGAIYTQTIAAADVNYTIGPSATTITVDDTVTTQLTLTAVVSPAATINAATGYSWTVTNPTLGFPAILDTSAVVVLTVLTVGATADIAFTVTDDNGLPDTLSPAIGVTVQ